MRQASSAQNFEAKSYRPNHQILKICSVRRALSNLKLTTSIHALPPLTLGKYRLRQYPAET